MLILRMLTMLVLITITQASAERVVSELEAQLLLAEGDLQPWVRIRNVGKNATLVCVRGVSWSAKYTGGGGGLMSHACTDESAFAIVLPNESHVARLPATFVSEPNVTLSVDIILAVRPFGGRPNLDNSSRVVVTWRGTEKDAQDAFRRLISIEQ